MESTSPSANGQPRKRASNPRKSAIDERVLNFVSPRRSSFPLVSSNTITNLNLTRNTAIALITAPCFPYFARTRSTSARRALAAVRSPRAATRSLIAAYCFVSRGSRSRACRQSETARCASPCASASPASAASCFSSSAWTRARQEGQTRSDGANSVAQCLHALSLGETCESAGSANRSSACGAAADAERARDIQHHASIELPRLEDRDADDDQADDVRESGEDRNHRGEQYERADAQQHRARPEMFRPNGRRACRPCRGTGLRNGETAIRSPRCRR